MIFIRAKSGVYFFNDFHTYGIDGSEQLVIGGSKHPVKNFW